MRTVSVDQVNRFLWHRQGFDLNRPFKEKPAFDALIGFYGSSASSYLGLLARVPSFQFGDLDRDLYETRQAVRARAMRATLFLISTAAFPAVFQTTKEQGIAAFRTLRRKSRVTDREYRKISGDIARTLGEGPKTVKEIGDSVKTSSEARKALNFIVSEMCAEGILIRARTRGGWTSDQWEYARLDEWLPGLDLNATTPAQGRVEVGRRYFSAYGPATVEDFQWWSGFAKAEAAATFELLKPELAAVQLRDTNMTYWIDKASESELYESSGRYEQPQALVPIWDAYLMGYRFRNRYLKDADLRKVYDRSGNATAALLARGKVSGIWEWKRGENGLTVKVALFDEEPGLWVGIRKAAQKLRQQVGAETLTLMRCSLPSNYTLNNYRSPLTAVSGVSE
jgi:hypothetical protein